LSAENLMTPDGGVGGAKFNIDLPAY